MKKMILASLLILGGVYADSGYNRPQIFYPTQQFEKAGRIFAFGEHELRGKSPDGIIELEDGTQFKAISSHRGSFEHWNFYDRITFCPNPYFFGGSEFYVINLTNGESFKVDIWASAAIKNTHTYRLSSIDRNYEEVVLVGNHGNKMRWKINSEDFDYLRFWSLGDVVITGKNLNWYSRNVSDSEYILVSYSATEDALYIRAYPKPL